MSENDDIATQLIEGSAYDEASLTVRRAFGLSLQQKRLVAIGTLLYAILLAPVLLFSQELIITLELSDGGVPPRSPVLNGLVLLGIFGTFIGGLLLTGQQYLLTRRSLDVEQARRFIRIEDFLMLFVIQGALFVVVPTTLFLSGALAPGVAEGLYDAGIRIYRPGGTLGISSWLVSTTGGGLAIVLAVLGQQLTSSP